MPFRGVLEDFWVHWVAGDVVKLTAGARLYGLAGMSVESMVVTQIWRLQ